VVFIHGKLFRRKYLVDNKIRFCDGLTLHEDVYFNSLAQAVAGEDRIGEIKTGFYLWCNNPQSVGRVYGWRFLFDTYDHLMKQRNAIIQEYIRREMKTQVEIAVAKTVVDAYYDFQTAAWLKPEEKEVYDRDERWFCTWFKRYAQIYSKVDPRMTAKLAEGSRDYHIKQGCFLMECRTLGDWLRHLINDVEPFDRNVLDV